MDFFKNISKFAAAVVMVLLISSSLIICSMAHDRSISPAGQLKVGFYDKTCPQAEKIVRNAVNKAVSLNPRMAAGLIRMHFHDCFVRGCDGSVLLDSVPGKPVAEKDNLANFPSLHGFDIINHTKAQIEAVCPQTVSCADILAFAARDSALKVGRIEYDVPSGRRDGRVSLSSEVLQNIPAPFFNATQLRDNFKNKGLSLDDMVTLSGAHSIGVSHCSSFSSRLSGFNATFNQDPSMDPKFAAVLKTKCPPGGNNNNIVVNNDFQTPNRLDNKYYGDLMVRKGLLASDQTLFDSSLTRNVVLEFARTSVWGNKFAAAMVKMGKIHDKNQLGEIRKKCNLVN